MTAKYNFKINQGSDCSRTLTFKDSSGTAIVIGDYSVAMQIRQEPRSSVAIDTLTTANGRITFDATNKKMTLSFPHEKTSTYPVQHLPSGVIPFLHYDIEMTSANGDVTRVLEGIITVSEEVTRVSV